MHKNTLIDYQNVCFSYGKTQILSDINIQINRGESVAIVGHNGAGKTTLIKLLIGILSASSGHAKSSKYAQTNKLSFMPEHGALYGHLRGIDLMLYFAKLKGADPDTIDPILELVEIKFASERKISNYSKGMKQRLLLAQALLSDPEILILDEPYSGLDPNSRRLFSKILQNLSNKGKSIILSSHTLDGLSDIVDNVIFINQGQVALAGKIDEIINNLQLSDKIEILLTEDCLVDEILQSVGHLITDHELVQDKLSVFHQPDNNMAILNTLSKMSCIKNIHTVKATINDAYYHLYNKK